MRIRNLGLMILLAISAAAGGCGVFRGIPTHGGGKRFDEEQRVVAGVIRQSLADMDFRELEGRNVQLVIECMAQDGGGTVVFPGIASISGGLSGNIGTGSLVQINQSLPIGGRTNNDNDNTNISGNVGVGYNAQTNYSAGVVSTLPDLAYFRAVLEMNVRHAGVKLATAEPDSILYVLVDVLGINRSRLDQFVSSTDILEASCEYTYYAMDPKSGELIFEARRASSSAKYEETRRMLIADIDINRTLQRTVPTSLPINSDPKPSTQPVVAKAKKPWWNPSRLVGVGQE